MSKQHEQWADDIAQRHWADGEATAEGLAANIANVVEAAVVAERERCAKVAEECELLWPVGWVLNATKAEVSARTAQDIAAAIRQPSPKSATGE